MHDFNKTCSMHDEKLAGKTDGEIATWLDLGVEGRDRGHEVH
jgi:hypothetical protein